MSLILEALRKSEAERHRGLPPRLDSPMLRPTRRRQRLAPGLALLVLGGPAAGWFVYRGMAPDFAESQVDTSLVALLPPLNQGAAEPGMIPTQALAASAPGAIADTLTGVPVLVNSAAADVNLAGSVPAQTTPVASQLALGSNGANGAALVGGSFGSSRDLPPPERMRPHTPSADNEQAQAARDDEEPAGAEKTAQLTPAPSSAAVVPPPVTVAAAAPPVPAPAAVPAPPPVPTQVASAAPVASVAPATQPLIPVAPPASEVPLIYDLSYEIRREMPKMDMSMHVYSGDRSARFIVLNGKRLQEGSTTGESEVQLLEIRRAGAVMEFRGSTFLLPRQGM